MSMAALRLEKFHRADTGAALPAHEPEAIEDAYRRGYQQGQDETNVRQLANVTSALLECAEKLADDVMIRALARREISQAIGPLLEAVLEKIGPIGQREQLQDFLTEQLADLTSAPDPGQCVIRCNAESASQVNQILQHLKLDGIKVETVRNISSQVEVSIRGGSSIFDPTETIEMIRHYAQSNALETKA